MKQRLFLVITILIYNCSIQAQLKIALPTEPQFFYGKDVTALVYDVHLRDSLAKEFKILSFKIYDNENRLLYNNNFVERSSFEEDTNRFVKYVWINIDSPPKKIIHQIRYQSGEKIITYSKDIIVPSNQGLLSVIPPVEKGTWLIWHAPADSISHRRTHLEFISEFDSVQGGFKIGYNNQRFAMDFEKLNDSGRIIKNNGINNEDYLCYGENILAVADGKVVAILDEISDNPNPPYRKDDWDINTICGNYIALDIGNSLIALYAHLKKHSIKVHIGDFIKQGEIIGQIGNTGRSSGAHLHFQISRFEMPYEKSGNSFLSEGVSFVFDNYISYSFSEKSDLGSIAEFEEHKFDSPINVKNGLPYLNEIIEIR
jgi:hypothetical protein